MPRRYQMTDRATTVQQTRQRIVQAARALHAEQGILGTNYEEIAQRAGTAPATVYRHFPSLDDLLPACARSIKVLQPLTPEQAAEQFRGLSQPAQRVEVLVRGTCECYARDHGWLQAAHQEADLLPTLREMVQAQRESLRLLVRTALAGAGVTERTVQVVAALTDFPVWKSLREAGLTPTETADQILELVYDHLTKAGVL